MRSAKFLAVICALLGTLKDLVGKKGAGQAAVILRNSPFGCCSANTASTAMRSFTFQLVLVQLGWQRFRPALSMPRRLAPGDFAQLKQPKGHMLGDTEKEIRFAYVGLAVSNRLLARQPSLVERYLRSAAA